MSEKSEAATVAAPAAPQILQLAPRTYRSTNVIRAELAEAEATHKAMVPRVEAYVSNRAVLLGQLGEEQQRWKKMYPDHPFDPKRLAFPIVIPPAEGPDTIRFWQIHHLIARLRNELHEAKLHESGGMG
jgi:hypothetical protein